MAVLVEAALPTGGFVTNIICDDGSLVLEQLRGEQIVIRAKVIPPLVVTDCSATRTIGTAYTNGEHRRTVTAAIFVSAGATPTVVSYHTVSGGTALDLEFGRNTLTVGHPSVGDGINQWVSFVVDVGANYSMTAVLGNTYGAAVIKSWVESDEVL
jgi:hypothetical protein